ncbi:hypothetical protein [Novosphingobium sp. CF614]|uniref:hypothetical protein n=1 Tax=Novosphingobium sp. CF614 TaxID=1884364 RepID=UPI001160A421|nr:hypothetical protein [Novosphingobium sp. CF614]
MRRTRRADRSGRDAGRRARRRSHAAVARRKTRIRRFACATAAHRRERDASYALYFSGIEALSAADAPQIAAAFEAVGKELDKAGLQRLTRYIPTIRRHIETNRSEVRNTARDEHWIKELKSAVSA